MREPVVSVIMSSYNHASVVARTIESVLSQSFEDFEFLIEDDGSTDGTAEVLKTFADKRIKLLLNEANRGAGVVTNRLISRTAGKYVALINSDDVWVPEKLARQVGWLDPNADIAAVLSRALFIDEHDRPLDPSKLPTGDVFKQENRSRGDWLRRFFYDGNCLCNPSMMIRRNALIRAGAFDNRLRQLPDLDMWVRVSKRERFHVDAAPLVKFRIWKSGQNVSAGSAENSVRTHLEHMLISETFFDGVDDALLREGFGSLLRRPDLPSRMHREIEECLLYFGDPNAGYVRTLRLIGYRKLYALLGRPDVRTVLEQDYGIDDRFFQSTAAVGAVLFPAGQGGAP
jgi:glycosyltransferase involved in cell wall biosynthesis